MLLLCVCRYIYPCCPSDPFPVVKFRVFVSRASAYYNIGLLIPTTLFTLLSFTVFFMSFEVGEQQLGGLGRKVGARVVGRAFVCKLGASTRRRAACMHTPCTLALGAHALGAHLSCTGIYMCCCSTAHASLSYHTPSSTPYLPSHLRLRWESASAWASLSSSRLKSHAAPPRLYCPCVASCSGWR